ncbi:hypothetical protein ABZW30_12870 [Kitasatospora sp. NPDC004669]|uniref:hypothetical protein n=1 Tax=Kitasatospora sp. NPDC004669 TaxID=3154555 RepID=UPI0033B16BC5
MGVEQPLGELAVALGQGVGGAQEVGQGLAGKDAVALTLRALQLEEEVLVVFAQRLAEGLSLGPG